MGITNLLPLLDKSTRPCHISEFRGLTVAVDSYCWLHKGARSCALQLAKGEATDMYVTFCLKYVNMLLQYDIKPIMVFDGRHLPAKLKTEEKRRDAKKHAKKQGIELLRLGKVDEAYKFFKQCVDVTPEMAFALIRECRKLNVDCIVAPYESDAQLAFFSMRGVADCIISEDSDLLLFGCKKVLYKMDLNGAGQLVEADKIPLSLKIRPDNYSVDKFRHMCILSGCDYVDSLPGVGLKKALKFVTMTVEDNPQIFLDRLPRYLNMRRLVVTDEYKTKFLTADATFKHQTVYDPFTRTLTPLNPVNTDPIYCKNAGTIFDSIQAFELALGNLNPLTMETMDYWHPTDSIINPHSIWSLKYTPRPVKAVQNSSPQRQTKKPRLLEQEQIEKINKLHDDQFEKELKFYKQVPVSNESQHDVVPQPDPETSPVLEDRSNNPFIKKKISKFNIATVSRDGQVVRSRYFAIPTLESCKEEVEQEGSQTETIETKNSYLAPDGVEVTDILDVQSLSYKDNSEIALSEMERLTLEIPDLTDEEFELVPIVECDCIIEVSSEVLKFYPDSPPLLSNEPLPVQPFTKKRKIDAGSMNKPKKQATITAMFSKMGRK